MLAYSASESRMAILAITSRDERHYFYKACPSFNMGIFLFYLELLVQDLL